MLKIQEQFEKSIIALMTGMLQVKAPAYDNHKLLSYHNNGFCDMIIILLHITIPKSSTTA